MRCPKFTMKLTAGRAQNLAKMINSPGSNWPLVKLLKIFYTPTHPRSWAPWALTIVPAGLFSAKSCAPKSGIHAKTTQRFCSALACCHFCAVYLLLIHSIQPYIITQWGRDCWSSLLFGTCHTNSRVPSASTIMSSWRLGAKSRNTNK